MGEFWLYWRNFCVFFLCDCSWSNVGFLFDFFWELRKDFEERNSKKEKLWSGIEKMLKVFVESNI